jgi:hypothetical protein
VPGAEDTAPYLAFVLFPNAFHAAQYLFPNAFHAAQYLFPLVVGDSVRIQGILQGHLEYVDGK